MRPKHATTLTLALVVSAGCSAIGDRMPDVPEWTVSEAPTVAIGAVAGDSAFLFQNVADAALLRAGGVAVADGGLSVVRIFDDAGDFVVQVGGQGEGPGEFLELRDIWVLAGDTIVAWDAGSLRLTYFLPDGALARTVGLQPSLEAAGVGHLDLAIGPLDDGTVALGSLAPGSPEGLGHDRVSVELFGPEGAHRVRLAEETGLHRVGLGSGSAGPGPFSPFPHFATHGSSVYFANGRAPEVHVWSESSERVLTVPAGRHDVDEAWSALAEELQEPGHDFYRGVLPDAPRPDSIPHVGGLLVDDAGRLWTKRYDPATDALWLGAGRAFGGSWWITEADGLLSARGTIPEGVAPIEVMGDVLLGVTVDALGVERVQTHRISRPPA